MNREVTSQVPHLPMLLYFAFFLWAGQAAKQ
jgi:hypothetical protein